MNESSKLQPFGLMAFFGLSFSDTFLPKTHYITCCYVLIGQYF